MTKLVELFRGRKKSITLFCSSDVTVFYIVYLNTFSFSLLNREKESSHIRIPDYQRPSLYIDEVDKCLLQNV